MSNKSSKTLLFWPGSLLTKSDPFHIPVGGQKTVVALGLGAGETVTFEIVITPAIEPDICMCPPGDVELPSVASSAPLTCCGQTVTLNSSNPFVIIDAPQAAQVRAVFNGATDNDLWVWVANTETSDVTDKLRGCPCQ